MRKHHWCSVFAIMTLAAACTTARVEDDEHPGAVGSAFTITQVSSFGSNPGALTMYRYVPSGLPTGRPLVMVPFGHRPEAPHIVIGAPAALWEEGGALRASPAVAEGSRSFAEGFARRFNAFFSR